MSSDFEFLLFQINFVSYFWVQFFLLCLSLVFSFQILYTRSFFLAIHGFRLF
jgi:hypothetical protein